MASRQARSPERAANRGDQLARHLDRLITDPTLIGNTEWNNQAKRLVDEHYKGK